MSLPARPLPRAVRLPPVLLGLLLLVSGAVMGSCSSSNGASSADAQAASDAVSRTFNLPDDATTCLREHFAADAKAARAMTSTEELSTSQQEAVGAVLEGCVTVDQWAQAVAGRITNALPPADTTKLTTQVECLTTAITALDEVQRRALLVGLVVIQTAPQTGPLAVQRGDVLNNLYGACSVKASK